MNILITGASSGIGKQLALDYAAKGHQVWGQGRNKERLQELTNKGITALPLELADLATVRSSLSELPAMDLIVLCAGNCEYLDPERFDAELFSRVWQANVLTVANCLDGLWGQLKPGSQLALVGSLAHLLPFSQAGAYGSSKAAIHYLSQALGTDLAAKQVSVHCVQPGFVKTPLTDKNAFAMPNMISSEQASQYIMKGLAKGKTSINFPGVFSGILHFLNCLPVSWQQSLCRRLAHKEGA
ncbi:MULTISPECIES: SDR family NAD(P)-dependent oxidoreductase [unclassified Agarivorans]|uniref:SDR family NAD(P)-dependent oxidoreductase n=1 Tax=unclassified Agarivorans TaxID=2636026 RepID=UPI0026E44F8C|nr:MULTISPECIES: SDR family NAD(P)-dependent oxidoreductase [unclassified Agarivorans]MDO6684157.1 SDR family NAD(P)-dependent oxidoreductase [Agarivorans sp. 3_MG-2023]MDO6714109.1 SDR family NAD(P)-dependent oxidoreductase [Agarivorans sp. 2_MG-2023]